MKPYVLICVYFFNIDPTLYPGGISTNYSYNPDNTVKSLSNQSASGVIDNYSYEYDDCGNMLRKTDSSGTTVYTYDPLNRIKTIVEPSKKTTEYEYDAAGNRIRERVTGGSEIITKDYTYNSQNRLMEIVKHDLTGNVEEKQKFVYDNNGNQLYFKIELTERATEDAKPSFGMFISGESYSGESAKKFFESNSVNTYNAFNQLIKTTVGDVEVRHKYDPEGKRIEKVTVKAGKSKTNKYLRLGSEIAMEVDEKGDVISRNVNGTAPISRETDGNKYFLLYNGEGDVTALVDRTGRVAERYEYDAFGNVTKAVDGSGKSLGMGESKNPVRYRGYEYDEETKLYYLNARMYDPSIARFIQEDTYRGNLKDPLSLNLYTYCHNNPIYYNDPTGHAAGRTMITEGDGGSKKSAPPLTTKNTPGKEPETSQKPATVKPATPKPITAEMIITGKVNEKELSVAVEKMSNTELLRLTKLCGDKYSSSNAALKGKLHSYADILRSELLENNANNQLIRAYVNNSQVKDAYATVQTGSIKLDSATMLDLAEDGKLNPKGGYRVSDVYTKDTKPAMPTKTASKVDEPRKTDPSKADSSKIGKEYPQGTPNFIIDSHTSLLNSPTQKLIPDAMTTNSEGFRNGVQVGMALLPVDEFVVGSKVTSKILDKFNNTVLKYSDEVLKGGLNKIVNSADDVIFKQSSIDKAFTKHSADFGKYADGSKASLQQFQNDVSNLIDNGIQKSGTWKGVEGTHIYNETTKQWAFVNADGTFNTAFKLSDNQFKYLLESGVVK